MKLADRLKAWLDSLKPKPAPTPDDPAPAPAPKPRPEKKVSLVYLLWQLWRKKIDPDMLTPLLVAAPAILLLAVSGALAWLAVLLGFFWRLLKMVAS